MKEKDGYRVGSLRPHMNEVDVDVAYLHSVLMKLVEGVFLHLPIVVAPPILNKFFQVAQIHPIGPLLFRR